MLLLLFHTGNDCFGIDVNNVIEISPIVNFKMIPNSDDNVAGMINYRGIIVPLIDLTFVLSKNKTRDFFNSRIIICNYETKNNKKNILGLLAEKVTETIPCNENDFKNKGIEVEDAKYLGDVLLTENGIIQRIDVHKILPEKLRESLFKDIQDELSA